MAKGLGEHMKRLIIVAIALALCGCAVRQKIENREAVNDSLTAYKACLAAHPDGAKACESARLAFEADLARQRNQAPAAIVHVEN